MRASTDRKPPLSARSAEGSQAEQQPPTTNETPVTCEDCNGTGIDSGSLRIAEPCPSCAGYGTLLPISTPTRKPITREDPDQAERDFRRRQWEKRVSKRRRA